jgi:hypothetical protein
MNKRGDDVEAVARAVALRCAWRAPSMPRRSVRVPVMLIVIVIDVEVIDVFDQ